MDDKKILGIIALIGGGLTTILINFTAGLLSIIIIGLCYIGSDNNEKTSNQEKLSDYRYAILVLLARVMCADGRQMKCELDIVKSTIYKYYITEEDQKAALKHAYEVFVLFSRECCGCGGFTLETHHKLQNTYQLK